MVYDGYRCSCIRFSIYVSRFFYPLESYPSFFARLSWAWAQVKAIEAWSYYPSAPFQTSETNASAGLTGDDPAHPPCGDSATAGRFALARPAHRLNGFFDRLDRMNRHAVDGLFRRVRFGYYGHTKTQLGGFLEPLLTTRRRSYPRQPDRLRQRR